METKRWTQNGKKFAVNLVKLFRATLLQKSSKKWLPLVHPFYPDPGRRKNINLNFYFHSSVQILKMFDEGLKGLHKTICGITKKFGNKLIFRGEINYVDRLGQRKIKFGSIRTRTYLISICSFNCMLDSIIAQLHGFSLIYICMGMCL